jgi:release factor glutamine methyltransferase
LVQQRILRIPLQHLMGTADFLDLRLRVTRDVLVPRPETEQLALAARERLPARTGVRVADLGTGSGCLALALAHGRSDLEVHAIDLSPTALEVARGNAANLGLSERVTFHRMDAFGPGSAVGTLGRFDLIVTNPPYIPSAEIPGLMPEVRDHDPLLALDGGPDGLAPYRVLAECAQQWLQPEGWLLAEFGDGQAAALVDLFRVQRWSEISIGKDLSGRDRILIVRASRHGDPANHLGASREDVPHRSHHG